MIHILCTGTSGLQRDVVYLGLGDQQPTSPHVGGGGGAGYQPVSIQLYTGAQINFGDVTLYFTNAGTDPPFQNKPTDPYPDLIKKLFHKRILIFLF
jgi:hypothetical protein